MFLSFLLNQLILIDFGSERLLFQKREANLRHFDYIAKKQALLMFFYSSKPLILLSFFIEIMISTVPL